MQMNIQVSALARTDKLNTDKKDSMLLDGIKYYRHSDLHNFLQNCNVIVSVLPETAATKGFCNDAFFQNMQANSIFINVGRGSVIDRPSSLIDALESGHLKSAVLDVYDTEPLPNEHAYYDTENLYITCHTAAISRPTEVFDVFYNNAIRLTTGKKLLYMHDFDLGY